MVKLDILVAGDPVDASSIIVHRDFAYERWARGSSVVPLVCNLLRRKCIPFHSLAII